MKTYKVDINGIEHTFQLDDAEAEARGLKKADTKAAQAPANKARKTTANKARG